MFNLPVWAKGLIILALAAAAVVAYGLWKDSVGDEREATVNARWEAEVSKIKLEAAGKLAAAEKRALVAEGKLQAYLTQRNLDDASNKTTVQKLRDDLRTARAATGGRMRDPNQAAAGCRGSGGNKVGPVDTSAGDRPADSPQTGGLLSEELTGLLDKLTGESDDINNAYISCRDDAFKVRQVLPTSQ